MNFLCHYMRLNMYMKKCLLPMYPWDIRHFENNIYHHYKCDPVLNHMLVLDHDTF